MSKLVLDGAIPSSYDEAAFSRIIRAICQQVNLESEGKLAGRYQAQVSSPSSVAAAVGDIVWNSTPSSGSPLGWVCVASGNPGTFYQFGGMPVLGTEVASTSGTSIDFTGIPAWVTRIEINFFGVSLNGSSDFLIQIGDSGGIETSGYLGASSTLSTVVSSTNYTAGFGIISASAANVLHGTVALTLEDAANFTWTEMGLVGASNGAGTLVTAGSKSTSAALDRVRITTVNGTDAFDAGAINIRMS